MSGLLKVTVWNDPDKPKALEGYRNVLKFLQKHPEVSDDDKMTIYLLDINSRRSSMLVNVYFGVFKVKEVDKIKNSMTDLIRILLDRIAPSTVIFDLTEKDDKVTLVIKDQPVPNQEHEHKSKEPQEQHDLETMDDTLERIATYSAASNIKLSRPQMNVEAPVKQVQTDMEASVASSVTASAKKVPSLSSVQTPQSRKTDSEVQDPNPVTPNPARNNVKDALPVMTTRPIDSTKHPTPVNSANDLFNLGTMPESNDTELTFKDDGAQVTGRTPIPKDPTIIDLTMTETPADQPADNSESPQNKTLIATDISHLIITLPIKMSRIRMVLQQSSMVLNQGARSRCTHRRSVNQVKIHLPFWTTMLI